MVLCHAYIDWQESMDTYVNCIPLVYKESMDKSYSNYIEEKIWLEIPILYLIEYMDWLYITIIYITIVWTLTLIELSINRYVERGEKKGNRTQVNEHVSIKLIEGIIHLIT